MAQSLSNFLNRVQSCNLSEPEMPYVLEQVSCSQKGVGCKPQHEITFLDTGFKSRLFWVFELSPPSLLLALVPFHLLSHVLTVTLRDRLIYFLLMVKINLFLSPLATLLTVRIWDFPHAKQLSNSLVSTGCLINSDANYSELGHTPQVENPVSQDCPLLRRRP